MRRTSSRRTRSRPEAEATTVDAAEPDPPGRPLGETRSGSGRVARQAEGARQHTRPAAWDETERRLAAGGVQHLVVGPVSREDVNRVDSAVGLAGEHGRVAGGLREDGLGPGGERRVDGGEPCSLTPLANGLTIRSALTRRA